MHRFAPSLKSNAKHSLVSVLAILLIACGLVVSSSPVSTSTPGDITRHAHEVRQQKKSDNKCTRCSPPGDQMIYIPLIDIAEARGGEIVFNSRSPGAMDITPVFYKGNGQTVIGIQYKFNHRKFAT